MHSGERISTKRKTHFNLKRSIALEKYIIKKPLQNDMRVSHFRRKTKITAKTISMNEMFQKYAGLRGISRNYSFDLFSHDLSTLWFIFIVFIYFCFVFSCLFATVYWNETILRTYWNYSKKNKLCKCRGKKAPFTHSIYICWLHNKNYIWIKFGMMFACGTIWDRHK